MKSLTRALAFLFALMWIQPVATAAAGKPNILLIFTDDQGIHDVGCYGSEIPTPNIDHIATEGIKFENWYSASSICTPSRFGLLTGKNPVRSKSQLLSALMFLGEEDKTRGIHKGETTIATALRSKADYHTTLIGKWHLGHGNADFLPVNHGFDRFIGHTGGCIDFFTMTYGILPDWYHQSKHVSENGYATELITEEAEHYLASRVGKDQPFFLYLAYNAPHFGKAWSPADQKPVNLMQPQAAELKRVASIEDKIRREFAAMVVSLDDGIGKVLDALETHGLAENTLVIFLTDHGGDPVYGGSNSPYRGDKATLFEGGLRVPCLMRWPGKIKPRSTSDILLTSLDLFPTLCALGGIDPAPFKPDGDDISTVLLGKPTDLKARELFWETGKHSELERGSWRALRSGRWKYVQSPKDGEFLFDIESDPYEKEDLSSANPETFSQLRKRGAELSQKFREKE